MAALPRSARGQPFSTSGFVLVCILLLALLSILAAFSPAKRSVRPLRYALLAVDSSRPAQGDNEVEAGLQITEAQPETATGTPAAPEHMVIVTGATADFFDPLTNLVGSIRFWRPAQMIAIYNFGLKDWQRDLIMAEWCGVVLTDMDELVERSHKGKASFVLDAAPRAYAQKTLAILDAVDRWGAALWLDAGSTVTGPLDYAEQELLRDGWYLVRGQDLDMLRLALEGTFTHLNVTRQMYENREGGSWSGNTQGYVRGSAAYHKVLVPMVQCALQPACISPPGASTANHRFDQTVLSILTYLLIDSGTPVTEHTHRLACERAQLAPCREPSEKFIWTSRRTETCYAVDAKNCSAFPAGREGEHGL